MNLPVTPPPVESFGFTHNQDHLAANLRKIDPELLKQIMGRKETT